MFNYIVRRLLQAIPLLLVVSLVIFVLLQSTGDPLATMGGRVPTRSEDRERLRRQLGLDQPLLTQYLYWLIGNDWAMVVDSDGDGIDDSVGERRGVLRGAVMQPNGVLRAAPRDLPPVPGADGRLFAVGEGRSLTFVARDRSATGYGVTFGRLCLPDQ